MIIGQEPVVLAAGTGLKLSVFWEVFILILTGFARIFHGDFFSFLGIFL